MESKMNMILNILLILQAAKECTPFMLESKSGPDPLKFIVLADWGGISFHPYTTPVQTSVADQMAIVSAREKVEFVVALGDNFYLYGVEDVHDPRFQTTFEAVYYNRSLQIPWYVVAGNHDYFGNVTAQIEYTRHSSRWKFPDFYQKVSKSIPGGKTLVIVLIDTIQLCGNVYSLDQQPVGPADVRAAETQWKWIAETLNESKQHIQMSKDGQTMNYFVAGAGNFVDKSQTHLRSVPSQDLKFIFADLMYLGGFSYFEVSDSEMRMKFIDGVGFVRHDFTMRPRK